MRTSMNIPQDLLVQAKKIGKTKTKTQVVIQALEEFIQKRKIIQLLDLKGSLSEEYDYKILRQKR